MADPLAQAVEIVPGRFYLAPGVVPEALARSKLASASLCFCIDYDLVYEPFYADFGPLNLGRAFRYCELAARLLQESDRRRAQAQAAQAGSALASASSSPAPAPIRVYHYCTPTPQFVANAAALAGIFQVMCLGRSADAACAAVAPAGPFMPFRDASCGAPCFALTVDHVIRGVAKARDAKLLDVRPVSRLYVPASPQEPTLTEQQRALEQKQRSHASPPTASLLAAARGPARASATCAAVATSWHMDVAEYEHYERVENGDANWILPGKLLAFSGPASRTDEYPGFRAMTPEDYHAYFAARGITAVVRLNRSAYEGRRFVAGGFSHHELYFPDGSCPPAPLLARFLALAEAEPGALAVHCKAGLGRTGVLACAYLMKHYGFKAEEALGYIRVVRPGSVIGPQQLFLGEIEPKMHAQGRAWRAAERKAARREEKKKAAAALVAGGSCASKADARVPPPLPVWGPAQGFEGLPVVASAAAGLAPAAARPQGRAAPADVWAESDDEEDWSEEGEDDEAADAAEEADLAARRAAERDAAAAMVRAMALGAPAGAATGASSATVTVLTPPKKAAASASSAGANGGKAAAASSSSAQQQAPPPSSSLASTLLSPRSAAAAAAGGIGASIGSAVSSLLAAAGARASAAAAPAAPPPPASPLTSGARALGSGGSKGGASAGGALSPSPDAWKKSGGGSLGGAASLVVAANGANAAPPSPAAAAAAAGPATPAVVRVLAPNGQPRKVPASMLAGAQNGVLAASIALMMGEEEGPAPAPAAVSAGGVTTRSAAAAAAAASGRR